MKLSIVVLCAALLASGACGGTDEDEGATREPAGPEELTIRAGEADDAVPNAGLFAFYPASIAVHSGDTITFDNGSGSIPVPHTVTLGSPADIPDRLPPPVVEGVGQVPAVWAMCVSEEPLETGTTDCPDGSTPTFPPEGDILSMTAFADQDHYNSGIFDPGQSVEMPIDAGLDAGTFQFFCYLHPATMQLSVEVVPDEEPTQTQADLDAAAGEQREADLGAARDALEAGESAELPEGTVMAGSEEGAAVVTAFFPQETSVPRRSTVTWVNEGNDPHVVSFEGGVGPHDPENFAPPSVPPGSGYTGGPAISGVFGMAFPAQSFALRFTRPGEYHYVCPIHPGMGGTVRVESG